MKTAVLLTILQLVAFSALATDCIQTQHWINGTPSEPIILSSGGCVYEANAVLAGRPHLRKPYFDMFASTVELAPMVLEPPLAIGYVGFVAVGGVRTVMHNNRVSRDLGLPRYQMLAWRWSW